MSWIKNFFENIFILTIFSHTFLVFYLNFLSLYAFLNQHFSKPIFKTGPIKNIFFGICHGIQQSVLWAYANWVQEINLKHLITNNLNQIHIVGYDYEGGFLWKLNYRKDTNYS